MEPTLPPKSQSPLWTDETLSQSSSSDYTDTDSSSSKITTHVGVMLRALEDSTGHGTIYSTIISILSTVIGGGVFALSAAFHYSSLFPGILMLLYVGALSFASMKLIVKMSEYTQEFSYMGICRAAFQHDTENPIVTLKEHDHENAPARRFTPIATRDASIQEDSITEIPPSETHLTTPKTSIKGTATTLRELQAHQSAALRSPQSHSLRRSSPRTEYMSYIAEATILLYTFGASVMFVLIIADSMQPLAAQWMHFSGFFADGRFWILATFPLLFALTCARHLTELRISSLLAFVTVLYVGFLVLVYYVKRAVELQHCLVADAPTRVNQWTADLSKAIPLHAVAYGVHYNLPALYHELRHRSVARMDRALYPSMVIIVLFYLQIGICGYLYFGETILSHGGDLLAQYPADDTWVNVGRLIMLLHFACVYPLCTVSCRRSLNTFLFGGDQHVSTPLRVLEAFLIVGVSCGLAVAASSISVVLGFCGSLFGVHIIMTYPALMYWRLFRGSLRPHEYVGLSVLIASGILFCIAGTVVQIKDLGG